MKMDIEGSEVEVLPDLAITGAMEHVDVIMAEWHTRLAGNPVRKYAIARILKKVQKLSFCFCPLMFRQQSEWSQSFTLDLAKLTTSLESSPHMFRSLDLDDESYMMSDFELPKCSPKD